MDELNINRAKTVGQIVSEIQQSIGDEPFKVNTQEITQEQEKDYLDNLHWCANHALKRVLCTPIQAARSRVFSTKASSCKSTKECKERSPMQGDFYIISLLKNEKVFNGFTIRNYFIALQKCPTPTFDQTVYKFNSITGNIELLWTLPNAEACGIYRHYKNQVPDDEQQLLGYIMAFWSGELDQAANFLNGDIKLN